MPRVALTFDDGPGPITAELLDVLAAAGWRATFFVLGRNIVDAPWCEGDTARARALVVRAMREGHEVGNHTFSHRRPEHWRELAVDLERNDRLLRDLRAEAGVDVEAPIAVRLPYGIRLVERDVPVETGTMGGVTLDPRLAVLASLGRTHVHWTACVQDWQAQREDGATLAASLIAHVQSQELVGLDAVVDLHDSGTGSSWGYDRRATLEAVRRVIEFGKSRGWSPFTVPVY